VTTAIVELWGGGSGSYASTSGNPTGGASGGGYCRKRLTSLTPGANYAYSVGAGGNAGTSGVAPTAGGDTTFSPCTAHGGQLNGLNAVGNAPFGAIGGSATGGDININGSDGGNADSTHNAGGLGGGAPLGGGMRSVAQSFGNTGYSPGGGASGAGTGAGGTTAENGAAGAHGMIVIRW